MIGKVSIHVRMGDTMSSETERMLKLCLAYCGPAFVILYIIFWAILGNNIPPPSFVGVTGEDFVASYYGKYDTIALGMLVSAFAGMLYFPWSALVATFMVDRNGRATVLSNIELGGGILTGWLLTLCPAMWGACAVLAGTLSPDIIKSMHATTWIIYDCTYMITTVQTTAIGLYTILNKEQRIFPTWAGWAAIVVGATFLPLTMMPFMAEGPFAVNGLWNFWIVFPLWLFAFFSVYTFFMLKHLHSNEDLQAAGVSAAAAE